MKEVVNTVIIKNKQLVILRKEREGKSKWILPGGKSDPRERDVDCLKRELLEELPFMIIEDFRYYKDFNGISPNNLNEIFVKVYFLDKIINFSLEISTNPKESTKESKLLCYKELIKLDLSNTTRKIIDSLKEEDYI